MNKFICIFGVDIALSSLCPKRLRAENDENCTVTVSRYSYDECFEFDRIVDFLWDSIASTRLKVVGVGGANRGQIPLQPRAPSTNGPHAPRTALELSIHATLSFTRKFPKGLEAQSFSRILKTECSPLPQEHHLAVVENTGIWYRTGVQCLLAVKLVWQLMHRSLSAESRYTEQLFCFAVMARPLHPSMHLLGHADESVTHASVTGTICTRHCSSPSPATTRVDLCFLFLVLRNFRACFRFHSVCQRALR